MVLHGVDNPVTAVDSNWDHLDDDGTADHQPFLQAARAAASSSSWAAVLQHTRQCIAVLKKTTTMSRLMTEVLILQAEAASQLHQFQEAIEALDLVLQLAPDHTEALDKRAVAHTAAGHHQASFMDLRRLSALHPMDPSIMSRVQQAAQRCAEHQKTRCATAPQARYTRVRRESRGDGSRTNSYTCSKALDAYQVLGLAGTASLADVKQRYKQLAAKLHPDKWMQADTAERQAAEESFKLVNAAYHTLLMGR